jgi:hypothetical protein
MFLFRMIIILSAFEKEIVYLKDFLSVHDDEMSM